MFGVDNGFCLDFDKWLDHDAVIVGAWALGILFQSCHLHACLPTLDFFSMMALGCLNAGV